jgi:hypothetical protein
VNRRVLSWNGGEEICQLLCMNRSLCSNCSGYFHPNTMDDPALSIRMTEVPVIIMIDLMTDVNGVGLCVMTDYGVSRVFESDFSGISEFFDILDESL